MDLRLSNLRRKHAPGQHWPKERKLQAVAQYLALGNMSLVSKTTGISYGLLREWKQQPWWKEFELEIRNTENLKLDTSLTKLVEKSLEAVADRLENGEAVWDSKTGSVVRKPVNMRDSAKVATDLLTKRELLRGNATSRSEGVAQISMQDQLKNLAMEFAKMVNPQKEVIDVEMVEVLSGDVDAGVEAMQDTKDYFEGNDDAFHEEREEGLQTGTPVGEDDSSEPSEGPSRT